MSNNRIGQSTATHSADSVDSVGSAGPFPSTPDAGSPVARDDPRLAGLRVAVGRLGRELAAYRVVLPDRQVAEEELAALDAAAAAGALSVPRLRESLLVVAGALGSVSALSAPLAQFHHAIDMFGAG